MNVKQVYKGTMLSRTKVKNNILRIWKMTTEDERNDWYRDANTFASVIAYNKTSLSKMCGVIAALSPRLSWRMNMNVAKDFLNTGTCGTMGANIRKSQRIMESDSTDKAILTILNGPKTSAFYLNIRYPNKANVVTIDRHAQSVALGYWTTDDDYSGMTKAQYEFFVQCYTMAAMHVGVSPSLMQSATWVRWRKIKTNYKRKI